LLIDVAICSGGVLVLVRTLPQMNLITQVTRRCCSSPRLLGVVAVLMFAMTIPMTRLANGGADHPQLPPLFVALGRGVLAAMLAALYLWQVRAPWPPVASRRWLAGVVIGGVIAFPTCMGWAVRVVPAWHASVVTGVLPLITAVLAAWWMGHRPRTGFWLAGAVGVSLVLGFVWWAGAASGGPVGLHGVDAILLLGMLGASVAYVAGATASRHMPSAQVMSWALVWALPITVPGAWWAWWQGGSAVDPGAIDGQAWWALLYVAACSSWLGFFAWYAALARDAMRVSQIQLLQPFAAMALSACILGEHVNPWAPVFALGVMLSVWCGQQMVRVKQEVSS
jgi:drug/metabolite transporter (DMT)-like permease